MSIQIDNTNAGTLTLKPAASGSYTLTFPSAVAAVNAEVPLPFKIPVRVVAPVPP